MLLRCKWKKVWGKSSLLLSFLVGLEVRFNAMIFFYSKFGKNKYMNKIILWGKEYALKFYFEHMILPQIEHA